MVDSQVHDELDHVVGEGVMYESQRVFGDRLREGIFLLLRARFDDFLHDATAVLVFRDSCATFHEGVVDELLMLGLPARQDLKDDVVTVDVVAEAYKLRLQQVCHRVDLRLAASEFNNLLKRARSVSRFAHFKSLTGRAHFDYIGQLIWSGALD